MANWRILVAAVSVLGAIGGCNLPAPRIFQPRGPIQEQRLEASMYDPYPDANLGPEMVGSRPRDFQKSLPEPTHSQPFGPKPRGASWGR